MTTPLTVPPSHQPLETDSFLDYSQEGLFAAPWLGRPDPLELLAVQRLARSLAHAPAFGLGAPAALAQLMEVRHHCLLAASALDPIPARHHYTEALKACTAALNTLHHATEGPDGALAMWALGVHSLIQAQLAMPDLAEAERLAREAVVPLSIVNDPLCAGAEADARAAARLAREPAELHRRLTTLADRIEQKAEYFRCEIEKQGVQLNQQLQHLVQSHTTAFRAVTLWGLLNLALMASLPLNGRFAPDIPWSLPLCLSVPVLWWLTWDRPILNGLRFFDWVRWLRFDSLEQMRYLARSLVSPPAQFRDSATDLLREGRRDRELLASFHLFTLPSADDTIDEAAEVAEAAKQTLQGEWLVELKDASPWPLADALETDPSILPAGSRIYWQ